eukprot:TRINITY_DN1926_c0_g1_i4.p1 TRINITY_DN1926_c0_g1~~TRINITY_DN1926_c0_g1_i4.p1  ORF type:complete len:735 (-),score=188.80 TRINITY_DN1926_c0_g1_i4:8-1906(-)
MEAEMLNLQRNIEKIEASSNVVTHHISPKRGQIEKLGEIYQLLQQLQFLAEVPHRLTDSLKTENYSDGISYYNKTAGILNRYSYLHSFKTIKENSDKALLTVKKAILGKFEDPQALPDKTQEYCNLLRSIDLDDQTLMNTFYDTRLNKLKSLFGKWTNFSIAVVSPDEPLLNAFKRAITNINATFFPELSLILQTYEKLFPTEFLNDASILKERITSDNPISPNTYLDSIFGEYHKTMSHQLIKSEEPEIISACLEHIATEFKATKYDFPKIDVGLYSKHIVNTITDNLIQSFIDNFAVTFRDIVDAMKKKLEEEEKNKESTINYKELLSSTEVEYFVQIDVLFERITPLIQEIAPQYPKLFEFIVNSMNSTLTNLQETGRSAQFPDPLLPRSYELLLANLWIHFEKEGITAFDKKLKGIIDTLAHSSRINSNKMDQVIKEMRDTTRETAQQILQHFVRIEGEKLGLLLRRYVETTAWLNKREPRYVEMIVDTLVNEITTLKNYLNVAFPITEDPRSTKRQQKGLFPNKLQLSMRIDFDKLSILIAILTVCLKTFLECVRLTTFGNYGYQQLQLNICYMKLIMTKKNLLEDKLRQILEMLDDILLNAEERTVDACSMEQIIIDRICDEKLKN